MVRRPPPLSAVSVAVVLGVAFVVWTGLVVGLPAVPASDRLLLAPALTPGSALAQISAAFSLLTYPGLVFASVAGLAVWARQRPAAPLSHALVLMIVLGWGGYALIKTVARRARPDRALDVLTASGYAYPLGPPDRRRLRHHRGGSGDGRDPAVRTEAFRLAGRLDRHRRGRRPRPVGDERALGQRPGRRGVVRRVRRHGLPPGGRGATCPTAARAS